MDSVNHFQHLGLFAVVVLGIMVLPGLDMALILGKTLTEGRRAGAAATAGVMLGGAVHVLVAMLGLGLLLTHASWAYQGLLLGGAVYLAWIGWTLWRDGALLGDMAPSSPQPQHSWRAGWQGLLTCLLNPKAYVFMLAIFPQFLRTDGLPMLLQGVLMGAIVVGTQALVYGGLVVGAAGLRQTLHRYPSRQKRMAQMVGVLLMASALWTAWSGWQQSVAP
jgi:threonine/homoserine/homoserine lactone efflux protein